MLEESTTCRQMQRSVPGPTGSSSSFGTVRKVPKPLEFSDLDQSDHTYHSHDHDSQKSDSSSQFTLPDQHSAPRSVPRSRQISSTENSSAQLMLTTPVLSDYCSALEQQEYILARVAQYKEPKMTKSQRVLMQQRLDIQAYQRWLRGPGRSKSANLPIGAKAEVPVPVHPIPNFGSGAPIFQSKTAPPAHAKSSSSSARRVNNWTGYEQGEIRPQMTPAPVVGRNPRDAVAPPIMTTSQQRDVLNESDLICEK
ncbi:unnamed protein product [Amoebophrya sp. A120]|nr:unnamed protein product [Amoebophrya sp. A120]|eukprot:GSA120T00019421001.1